MLEAQGGTLQQPRKGIGSQPAKAEVQRAGDVDDWWGGWRMESRQLDWKKEHWIS